MTYKSGFISVIGRPNVGKSTLVNRIIGEKIAITSPKPQTTRNRLHAVYTEERGQIIFVDTPGVLKGKNELDRYMLDQVYKSLDGIDLAIFLIDATTYFGRGDEFIFQELQNYKTPTLVVLNKIDKLKIEELDEKIKEIKEKTGLDIIPVSALDGRNIDYLIDVIFQHLPEGPQYYPDDMITDQIEQFIIAEMIREKIFLLTREEIPYGIAVLIEEMKERENGLFYIRADIYVEKDSHKGIIIGKDGRMLKQIGKLAREDIEQLLQTDIYLDLWVKVLKDWRTKEELVRRMGYR
ncbi:MAG: GTPase Era [Halanaerobiaceae bacterium]|nr:GTPase Era [Halanaerobiaceae bacterium]